MGPVSSTLHAPGAARRLALGTVQLGLSYGVANTGGQVPEDEAGRILLLARRSGLDTLDTAIAYGASEAVLGRLGLGGLRVVTKLPPWPGEAAAQGLSVAAWVRQSVRGSLARLGLSRLHGLLLHRSADLLGEEGPALYAALAALRAEGLAARVGVSIYAPGELDALVEAAPRFTGLAPNAVGARASLARGALDLVQAPFNVLDRRLLRSGWLARLHGAGVEVDARSVFLQGLLLMDAARRPRRFAAWEPLWRQWEAALREQGASALEACLAFALGQPELERVVVGVDSAAQLHDIVQASGRAEVRVPDALCSDELALIDPSKWSAE